MLRYVVVGIPERASMPLEAFWSVKMRLKDLCGSLIRTWVGRAEKKRISPLNIFQKLEHCKGRGPLDLIGPQIG